MTQTFARMPRGTQKKTLVWKKLYRDICEAHSSRKNCILILLFVVMLFLFALIIYVYESNLDRKGEYWCRYTFCIQLGHVVTCSWIHFQVKSHSIWYEPILTLWKWSLFLTNYSTLPLLWTTLWCFSSCMLG